MPNLQNIDVNQILQYVDLAWIILFALFVGGFALAFLRGLIRGWKHGTFRFIFLGGITVALLFLLPMLVDVIGRINLSGFIKQPLNITMSGKSISVEVTTLFDTVYRATYGVLHDLMNVKASPEAIANYAIAFTGSALRLALVVAIAIVVGIVGSLLSWILWHLLFKHFIPKARRHPRARWISGLEEGVVFFALLCLAIAPITGTINAVRNNSRVPSTSEENETVALVNRVIDSFEKSIFNQAFLAWTKGDGTDTIDTKLAEFFAASTYKVDQDVYEANLIKEVRVFAGLEGGLVNWMYGEQPNKALATTALHTSLLMANVMYQFAVESSTINNSLVPLTFDIARNVDLIADEFEEDVAALEQTDYRPATAKPAYARLAHTEYVSAVDDLFQGEYAVPMYDSSCSYSEANLDSVRKEIESSPSKRALVNAYVSGYVLGQAESNPIWQLPDESGFAMIDLLPQNDNGIDEEALSAIDWWNEANIFHDVQRSLARKNADSGDAMSSLVETLTNDFISAFADNPQGLEDLLIGPFDEQGEPTTGDRLSLFDSDLVTLVAPAAIEAAGFYLQESVFKDDADVDIQSKISDTVATFIGNTSADTRVNLKKEFKVIFDLPVNIAKTDAGKKLILDYKNHPGFDFGPQGNLLNADKELCQSFVDGIATLDASKLFTTIMPDVADHFITPQMQEGGALAELGIERVDFHVPNLCEELSDILSVTVYCNDLIPTIGSLFGEGKTYSADASDLASRLFAYESEENHYQISHLLDIITDSPILNPVAEDGSRNGNIVGILTKLLSQMEGGITIEAADFADVTLPSRWDGDQIDVTALGESHYIVAAAKKVVESGLIDNLSELQDGDATKMLNVISKMDIEGIFSSIGGSSIMRKIIGSLLDERLLESVINNDKALDLTQIGVSFRNLQTKEDWEHEGANMRAIFDLATKGLDLSNLDFTSPAVIELVKCLSASNMFYDCFDEAGNIVRDEAGNIVRTYVFGDFFEDKLLLSLTEKDVLKMFMDYPEAELEYEGETQTVQEWFDQTTSWSGKETLPFKKALCSVFIDALSSLNDQDDWDDELDHLGSVLKVVRRLGGFDAIGEIGAENLPTIRQAVAELNNSRVFGPVLLANVMNTALTSESLPSEIRDADLNVGFLYQNAKDLVTAMIAGDETSMQTLDASRKHEFDILLSMINVVFSNESMMSGGSFDLNLATLNVEAFLRPVLEGCAASKILNPQSVDDLYEGEMLTDTTAFTSLLTNLMTQSEIYVDEAGTKITDANTPVQGSTKTIKAIIAGIDTFADWENEIDSICDLIVTLQGTDFLAADGSFDLSALEDFEKYFSKSDAKEELARMLNGIMDSELFYRCLAPKLENAIGDAFGDEDPNSLMSKLEKDLKCADFFFTRNSEGTDFAPYSEGDIQELVDILKDLSSCTNIDMENLSTLKVGPLTNAMVAMGKSDIFNLNTERSSRDDTYKDTEREGLTCFQNLLCDVMMVDALKDYFYLEDSPKDIANQTYYTDADTKTVYVITSNFKNLSQVSEDEFEAVAQELIVEQWGDMLRLLQQPVFAEFIAGNENLDSMTEGNFASLLHQLNDTLIYRDCVPNAMCKVLTDDEDSEGLYNKMLDAGIDLQEANFFFSYYHWKDEGGVHVFSEQVNSVPDFDMPFYDVEIDHMAMMYASINGNTDTLQPDNIRDLDAHLLRSILFDLRDSYVLHIAALDKPNCYTPFQQAFGAFMENSKMYDDVLDANKKIAETDLTIKDVIHYTETLDCWQDEIENVYELLDLLQSSDTFLDNEGNFSMDKLNNLSEFFDENHPEYEVDLRQLMVLIENGQTTYRCLPSQLKDATDISGDGDLVPKLNKDLQCADYYYTRTTRHIGGEERADFDPYSDEEVNRLIDILKEMRNADGLQMDDLSSVDTESLVLAMKMTGQSPIFNSNVALSDDPSTYGGTVRAGLTAHQLLLSHVVVPDSLNDYYYLAASPKDDATIHTTVDYTSADEKIVSFLSGNIPTLSATLDADGYEAKAGQLFAEWDDCLATLATDQFSDFVKGDADVADLTENDLKTLLHALNDCTFYRDCVPNALYKTVCDPDAQLYKDMDDAGIDMGSANFFFSYYHWKEEGGVHVWSEDYTATPDFDIKFYGVEIDHIAHLYDTLNKDDNAKMLQDPKIGDVDAEVVDEILEGLHDSYALHIASLDKTDYTPFMQSFNAFLTNSNMYEDVVDGSGVINETDLTVKDVILYTQTLNCWQAEIDNVHDLLVLLQSSDTFLDNEGNFSMDALNNLSDFFNDPQSETDLRQLLKLLGRGETTYRCLPGKLKDATKISGDGDLVPKLNKDLQCADYYYTRTARLYGGMLVDDFNAYSEAEVDRLIDILKEMKNVDGLEMNNLSSVDTSSLVKAMKMTGQSPIFNTNATLSDDTVTYAGTNRAGLTSHQLLLSHVVIPDSLNDYYFLADSPKDQAAENPSVNYVDGDTKNVAFILGNIPILSATLDADGYEAEVGDLFDEWDDCLATLATDQFNDFVSGASDVGDLTENDLRTLLHALNDCTFYRDCVPNALYKTVCDPSTQLYQDMYDAGIDMASADFFFSYHHWKEEGGDHVFSEDYNATPDYDIKFYGEEIDHIAHLYDVLNQDDNAKTLQNPNIKEVDENLVDEIFNGLYESYALHIAALDHTNYTPFLQSFNAFLTNSKMYEDVLDANEKVLETDLTVKDIVLYTHTLTPDPWPEEIETVHNLLDLLKNSDTFLDDQGNFSMEKLGNLSDLFSDDETEQDLRDLLNLLESGETTYRCLPGKLKAATKISGDTELIQNINKDLKCTDYYHTRTTRLYNAMLIDDFDPYEQAEVTRLVDVLKKMQAVDNLDLTDLASADTDGLVEAMSLNGQSKFFNTNTELSKDEETYKDTIREGMTAHQLLLSHIIIPDALGDSYYLAESPKDNVLTNPGITYNNADSKTVVFVNGNFPILDENHNAEAYVAETDALYDEWGDCLETLSDDALSSYISGGAAGDLSEANLKTLLHALNDCTFYRDCVPNVLHDTLCDDSTQIYQDMLDAGIDMTAANFFFSYYHWKDEGGVHVFSDDYTATPDFDIKFYDGELDHIAHLYSVLKDNTDTLKNPNIKTVDSSMLSDLLAGLHDSYSLHLASLDKTNYTPFLQSFNAFLTNSKMYEDVLDLSEKVKQTDLTVKDIVLYTQTLDCWHDEIDNVHALIAHLQSSDTFLDNEGNFSMGALNNLTDLFSDAQTEGDLRTLLALLENGETTYRCLPGKLHDATDMSGSGALMDNIKKDLKCADYYYTRTTRLYNVATINDFDAYAPEEVTLLVDILKAMQHVDGLDLGNLAAADTDSIVEAMQKTGQSQIFNTNVELSDDVSTFAGTERAGMTSHQLLLSHVIIPDALGDYYYLASSPKDDVATNAAVDYDSADTKTVSFVDGSFPTLVGRTVAQYDEATSPLFTEWKDCLTALKDDEFTAFIGGSAIKSLSEATFANLLITLNNCSIYRDCVPNAIYKSLVNDVDISGIDFSSADVFFSYYCYKQTGTDVYEFSFDRQSTPKFDMPFYEAEILQIAHLYKELDDQQAMLTSLQLDSIDAPKLREILLDVNESCMFHETAQGVRSPITAIQSDDNFKDLTVFEQFMYKILKDTTLYSTNFDRLYDYAYTMDYGDKGPFYKAHAGVLNLPYVSTWVDEINALICDEHPETHDGTDENPYVGIFYAGQQAGIFDSSSEVGTDFARLNTMSPKQIKALLYAINDSALIQDALANTIGNLLGANDAGDGIGMSVYSMRDNAFTGTAGQTSFTLADKYIFFNDNDLNSVYHPVVSIDVPVATNPSGHYTITVCDEANSNITDLVTMKYDAGVASFDVEHLPKPCVITFDSGYAIAGDVNVTHDLASYYVGRDSMRNKGIKAIGYLLSSAYRGLRSASETYGCYFSFNKVDEGKNLLDAFFRDPYSDYGHSTYGLLYLFANSGFYSDLFRLDGAYTTDVGAAYYSAGAYTFFHALTFKVEAQFDVTIDVGGNDINLAPSAELSVGKYIGQADSDYGHIHAVQTIFDTMVAEYADPTIGFGTFVREARWFDTYATSAATFDLYNSFLALGLEEDEVQGYDITNPLYRYVISSTIDQAAAKSEGVVPSIQNALENLVYTYDVDVPNHDVYDSATDTVTSREVQNYASTGTTGLFEKSILAGLVQRYHDLKVKAVDLEYNAPSIYAGGSKKYTRIGDPSLKVADEAALLVDLYDSDYAALTSEYLGALSTTLHAMSIIDQDGALSDEAKAALQADYVSLDGQRTNLVDILYLTSLYDAMLTKGFFKLVAGLPPQVTDMPYINQQGVIGNVATDFSYTAVSTCVA